MKTLKLTLITMVLSSTLFGQELLTLEQAINRALEQNHLVQIARNTVQISENNLHIGNAGFLPKLDLSAGVNYSDGTSQSAMGDFETEATQSSAQLEASLNLFNGFYDYFTYQKLQAQSESGTLSMRNNIESTIVQVVNSYYSSATAEDRYRIAGDALIISKERYERSLKKSNYGQANRLDLLNAKVDLNSDSISYLNARQQFDESHENLLLLLGLESGTSFTLEKEVQFVPMPLERDLMQTAYQNNSDYLIAMQNLHESEYDLKMSRAVNLPRLDLRGTYGYNQMADGLDIQMDDPYRNITGGLSLSFNLFNGFKNKIQTQNTRIQLDNRSLLKDQAKLKLQKDLTNAYSSYRNKRSILNMTNNNLESAELNFERTEELFNLGQLTNTQFREAQLNLVQARNGLSEAKFQAKTAEVTLMQLSGQLLKEN